MSEPMATTEGAHLLPLKIVLRHGEDASSASGPPGGHDLLKSTLGKNILPPQPSLPLQNIINSNSTSYHNGGWMQAWTYLTGPDAPSGCLSFRRFTLNNHRVKETW